MSDTRNNDPRIPRYLHALEKLKRGEYNLHIAADSSDQIGKLGQALQELAQILESRYREIQKLEKITTQVNAGLFLEDILEHVYQDFRDVIPYNRIGLALIESDGQTVKSRWAKSDQLEIKLKDGYSASLEGSSLQKIIETQQPRILNDLRTYLVNKPDSISTHLIVAEGIQSSLTCPLIANGIPIGFIFFSSTQLNAYAGAHIEIFQKVAEQLSLIVEKGRLVSELMDQKVAIERQNEELHHLNDLKNMFLGVAAHDLRSPLGVIQTTVELLLGPDASLYESENQFLLETIGNQVRHMLVLINDLLDFSEIESGKLTLTPEQFDIQSFLDGVIVDQRRIATLKGTQIRLEMSIGGKIMADKHRLRQVMENLISNAIKYSPPGSAVVVQAVREDTRWRVNVRDEGPGIKPEDRERLFKPFSRLSSRPTGGEKSTGLGLAVSRWAIEAHGGEIGVEAESGKGSNFWFTIPDELDGLQHA